MKILVSGRRTNTLQDIRAAVAAAEKTGSASKMPTRVTIEDMKVGSPAPSGVSMAAANTNILMRLLVNRTAH